MSTVRLVDGTEVDSYSEAWRHECEARAVCNMPTQAMRHAFLFGGVIYERAGPKTIKKKIRGVAQIRGQAAADELAAKVKELWVIRKKLSA